MNSLKNLNSRAQLGLIAGLIVIVVIGLFFYYLDRSNNRLETQNNNFPTNNNFEAIDSSGNVVSVGNQPIEPTADIAQIRQITDNPIAGYQVIDDELSSRIRYVESETGYVFDYYPETNTRTRITNTNLLRITKATWVGRDYVLLQYDSEGQSVNYFAYVNSAEGKLTGEIFPNDIVSIIGPTNDDEDVYYTTSNDTGGSNLYRYEITNRNTKFLQKLPLAWLDLHIVSNNTKNSVFATSKISDTNQQQVIFKINADGKGYDVININGAKNGLVLTDGYSLAINDSQSNVVNMKNRESVVVPATLLANKCGASNIIGDDFICAEVLLTSDQSRNWPFNWLTGQLKPNEQLIGIDPDFGDTYLIADLKNSFDVEDVQVTNDYIYFIGRNTDQLFEVFRG